MESKSLRMLSRCLLVGVGSIIAFVVVVYSLCFAVLGIRLGLAHARSVSCHQVTPLAAYDL